MNLSKTIKFLEPYKNFQVQINILHNRTRFLSKYVPVPNFSQSYLTNNPKYMLMSHSSIYGVLTASFHFQSKLYAPKLDDYHSQKLLDQLPPEQKTRVRIIIQEFEFMKVLN